MKVLVSAASKHGATTQIAAALPDALAGAGHDAEVVAPEQLHDLDGVGAVVLGSGVDAGRWLKPAREAAARLAPQLDGRPVWLFSSGPVGHPPMPDPDGVDIAAIQQQTGALEHMVFAGRLDRSRLGFAERALVHALRAPEGDFRDFQHIGRWAADIAGRLGECSAAMAGRSAP